MKREKERGGAVGYRSPPKEHQFQKGQSGNPAGGSRKRRLAKPHPMTLNQAQLWQSAGQELVTITVDGESQRVPMNDVIIRRIMTEAAKGKPTAMRLATAKFKESEESLRDSFKTGLVDAMELQREAMREAARQHALGVENPVLIPHPDDFVFDPITFEPSMVGPVSETQHNLMMEAVRDRDLLWHCLERAAERSVDEATRQNLIRLRKGLKQLDESLPPRLRKRAEQWAELSGSNSRHDGKRKQRKCSSGSVVKSKNCVRTGWTQKGDLQND